MTTDLDINEVAVGVAAHIFDNTASMFSRSVAAQVDKLKIHFKTDFAAYVSASLARTNSVKTLLSRDEPIPLGSVYTPLTFRVNTKRHTDKDIIDAVRAGQRLLISGTAGGGKSMLIRHLNVTLISNYRDLLPIYFELRSLNNLGTSLLDAIFANVNAHINSLSHELFLDCLKRGKFCLVLDGFDEIDHHLRPSYGAELDAICTRFPKLAVAVTTRPEENLPGLQAFIVYHALRMEKSQTLSLLSKLNFDEEKKSQFIGEVDRVLYNKHEEFLSNPLMATMMLLTYSYHSEIPAKIHIFYQQAFETLYQRHDRNKGVYTRKSYSELPIDDFQRVFEHFCAATYIAQKFNFSEISVRQHLNAAAEYAGVASVGAEALLSDLLESTCLLQRDGVDISFVHRSFQEYFTARFVSRLDDLAARKMIDAICARSTTDNTLDMLMDIDRELFERAWAFPMIKRLIAQVGPDDLDELHLAPSVFDQIVLSPRRMTMGNQTNTLGRGALAIWKLYDVSALEGQPSQEGETLVALEAIIKDPLLQAELKKHLHDNGIYKAFIDSGLKKDPALYEGESAFVDVKGISDDLCKALRVREVIHREIDAWNRIKAEIEARTSSKRASIDSMLKRDEES